MSDSLQPHALQYTRLPSLVCHQLLELTPAHVDQVSDAIQTISSSVVPFSSHLQYFPPSGSFQINQFFASGGQSIMTTGKIIALTIQNFVRKVTSLLFNMLSRFVMAFLPRSKHLLILWQALFINNWYH